jgi:hypothetical protein
VTLFLEVAGFLLSSLFMTVTRSGNDGISMSFHNAELVLGDIGKAANL